MMKPRKPQRHRDAPPAPRAPARLAGTIVLAAVAVALAAGPAAAWPRAASRTSAASAVSINCPPPNPQVTALISGISDC